MNWFQDFIDEILAILALAVPALESLLKLDPSNFWIWIGASIGFATLMYGISRFVGRLWFKKYQLSMTQHFFWFFASVLSGCGVMLWVASTHLANGLVLLLMGWQSQIDADTKWGEVTHIACYEAVKALNIEDFTKHPHPSTGKGSTIPLNKPESRLTDARVMIDRASVHFADAYPSIGRLLNVTNGLDLPTSELNAKVDAFFDTADFDSERKKSLPQSTSIKMCADILTETFSGRSDTLVYLTRFIALAIPLLTWLALFGWIGSDANKIMRNRIRRVNITSR